MVRKNVYQFLISLLLCVPAASAVFAENEVIKIGAILHLTGDLAMPSQAFREGIDLAVESYKENPSIRLILEDGKNDPRTSNSAAKKLISFDKVSAIILSSYLDAASSTKEFQHAEVPAIVIWDSNPEIEAMGDYIFGIGPWTPSAGETAARFSFSRLKAQKAAIFLNSDSWSESVGSYFRTEFTALGGKSLEVITLTPEVTDFRSVLARVKSMEPEVIYTPLVNNLNAFYSQIKQLGLRVPVVTSDIIVQEHLTLAPENFEGVYQTSIPSPKGESFTDLERRYSRKFGKEISMPWFVATGYDAMNLLFQAVSKVGANGKEINAFLYTVKDYPGASGSITISERRSNAVGEVMYQIRSGKFVEVSSE